MRSSCAKSLTAAPVLRGQLEVDVLERRAAHLEVLELHAALDRLGGQLVQAPRRLGRLLDDHLAVPAVADLGLGCAAGQLGRRADADDPAFAEHGDPVGELLGLVEVVRGQEDRRAERAEVADRLPGGAPRAGIEPGRRLVEEHELGVADEREPEVEPALLAARERPAAGVRLLGQPDDLDDLGRVARARVVAAEHVEALAHRQVRVERRGLEDDAEPLAPGPAGARRILAEHLDVARVAVAVALEDLDRRRLAGAVRPEQPEHLAGADLEVDAPDRLVRAVALPQPARERCTAPRPGGRSRCQRSTSAKPAVGNWTSRPVRLEHDLAAVRLVADHDHRLRRARPLLARRPSAVAPGCQALVHVRLETGRRRDRLRGLAGAQERARDDGVGSPLRPGARRASAPPPGPAPSADACVVRLPRRRPWHDGRGSRALPPSVEFAPVMRQPSLRRRRRLHRHRRSKGTSSRSSPTRATSTTRRCRRSRRRWRSRRPCSSCRRASTTPTSGSASSRRPASFPSPGIRRSARPSCSAARCRRSCSGSRPARASCRSSSCARGRRSSSAGWTSRSPSSGAVHGGGGAARCARGRARRGCRSSCTTSGRASSTSSSTRPQEVAALEPDLRALVAGRRVAVSTASRATARAGSRACSRPADGVAEDPATGSAAGPLAVHLARHGRIGFGEEIEILQGVELGRPSTALRTRRRLGRADRASARRRLGGRRRARRVQDSVSARASISGSSTASAVQKTPPSRET